MFAIEVLTGVKIAMLLIVAISALVATVFLVHRARGVTTQAFWLQLFGVCGWSSSLFFALAFHSVFAAEAAFVFPPFFAAGLLLISLAYPSEEWKPVYHIYLAPLVLAAIGGAIPGFFVTHITFHDGYLDATRSHWNIIYSITMLAYAVVPTVLLLRRSRAEARAQLSQRLYLLGVVSGVSYGLVLVTNSLLPALFHFPYLNASGPIWSIPVTFASFWLLAQRYSVDERKLKSYIVGRVVIFLTSSGVFMAMLSVLHMTSLDPYSAAIAAGFTTILTLTALGRVIHYVIEKVVHRNTYDRAVELTEVLSRAFTVQMVEQSALAFIAQEEDAPSADILLTSDVDEFISERVAEFISASLPGAGSFFLREHAEGEEWGPALSELADTLGAGLIIPLVHDRRVIGVLSLGEKRNGYTVDDCVRLARYGRTITAQLIRAALATHAEQQIANLEAMLMKS